MLLDDDFAQWVLGNMSLAQLSRLYDQYCILKVAQGVLRADLMGTDLSATEPTKGDPISEQEIEQLEANLDKQSNGINE